MSRKIPLPGAVYDQGDMNFAMQVIEQRLTSMEAAIAVGYVVSNGAVVRTLDVATATATDVAKFVGTLVADLKVKGRLG
jgi:hypothetical protein